MCEKGWEGGRKEGRRLRQREEVGSESDYAPAILLQAATKQNKQDQKQ